MTDITDYVTEPRAAVARPVRRATPDDIPALAATLAEAFQSDPVMTWCFPDPVRRAQLNEGMFRIVLTAALPFGGVRMCEGAVAGAIWVPPTAEIDEERLGADLVELGAEYGERVATALELLDANHPKDQEHEYLFILGTRAAWQSKGLGSALVRSVTVDCDRNATGAYLEATSERNRSLYERHGFEVTRTLRLPDGPPIFCMWRTPM